MTCIRYNIRSEVKVMQGSLNRGKKITVGNTVSMASILEFHNYFPKISNQILSL
jgi:hypothetical protein